MNDVNSFNKSIINNKEMITYFKDKSHKSKMKSEIYKTLTTPLKSFGTIVIIATISSSITLVVTGIGLIAILISGATACRVSTGNIVLYEIVMEKFKKYKKHYQRDQQTFVSFDNFYRKSLHDKTSDISEYESLSEFFIKVLDGTKNECYYEYEHKNEIEYFY